MPRLIFSHYYIRHSCRVIDGLSNIAHVVYRRFATIWYGPASQDIQVLPRAQRIGFLPEFSRQNSLLADRWIGGVVEPRCCAY